MPRQHPKRFENQTGNRPRNRVNSNWHVALRPGKRKALEQSTPMVAVTLLQEVRG